MGLKIVTRASSYPKNVLLAVFVGTAPAVVVVGSACGVRSNSWRNYCGFFFDSGRHAWRDGSRHNRACQVYLCRILGRRMWFHVRLLIWSNIRRRWRFLIDEIAASRNRSTTLTRNSVRKSFHRPQLRRRRKGKKLKRKNNCAHSYDPIVTTLKNQGGLMKPGNIVARLRRFGTTLYVHSITVIARFAFFRLLNRRIISRSNPYLRDVNVSNSSSSPLYSNQA